MDTIDGVKSSDSSDLSRIRYLCKDHEAAARIIYTKVSYEIANIDFVSPEQDQVLENFHTATARKYVLDGGIDYAKIC